MRDRPARSTNRRFASARGRGRSTGRFLRPDIDLCLRGLSFQRRRDPVGSLRESSRILDSGIRQAIGLNRDLVFEQFLFSVVDNLIPGDNKRRTSTTDQPHWTIAVICGWSGANVNLGSTNCPWSLMEDANAMLTSGPAGTPVSTGAAVALGTVVGAGAGAVTNGDEGAELPQHRRRRSTRDSNR